MSNHKYLITLKSGNAKVGPLMVTTSPRATCPSTCAFKANGCYAEAGPLRAIWNALDNGTVGEKSAVSSKQSVEVKSHDDLLAAIRFQKPGALWRHNQAGDLPGSGDAIDTFALLDIVEANEGRKGFTYTHKPVMPHLYDTAAWLNEGKQVKVSTGTTDEYTAQGNRKAIENANRRGFTVNLSANSLTHADELADLNIGPVAAVVPMDTTDNTTTPAGRKVVICPATQRDDVSCATCGLCQRQRDFIIGFPAHGVSAKKVSVIASK